MGGFDEHGGIIGDWMPPSPSPSPRAFFAAMLGDETGSRSGPEISKYENNTDSGFTFPGLDRQIGDENGDGNQRGHAVNEVMKTGEFGEQKMGARGSLVERMAARAGHNAPRLNTDIIKPVDSLQNQQARSPYLTIPPGLSPTSFLESPVFLSNSLVQPSPTTGKFQFGLNGNSNGNGRSSMMFLDSSKDNFFEEPNAASFAFKPFSDSAPLPRDHVNPPPFMSAQSFQSNETLIHSEKQYPQQKIEPAQHYSDFSIASSEKNLLLPNGSLDRSQQHLEEHHDDNADQRVSGDINNATANNASSDDGYNWRKYGQKQVKGSEYPRSYYKCTHQNCPVKKKVERSHEGHITEIIYKGAHNHPKLAPSRRSGVGSSSDMQGDTNNNLWGQESNIEVNSSGMVMNGQNGQNSGQFESSDAVGSTTFSNDEEEDRVTHGSVSLGYDAEGDESESKRRKVEAYAADVSGATRAIREPRVVVQTTSEVDILDDGYRWRKYGQKVVKGNPNPRSYYKCTSTGCTVRKHVERASHDLKSVITTYEGKHNHDVPAARNSSHTNNNNNNNNNNSNAMAAQQALSMQTQVHMTNASQMQNTMARFDRPPYGLHNSQHIGPTPTHNYGYLMNQQGPGGGLAHMGMVNHQGKMPALSGHHYLGQLQQQQLQQQQQQQLQQQQQRQMNEMGIMVPKGEPKVEPMSDPGLPNGAYHQTMNRLP